MDLLTLFSNAATVAQQIWESSPQNTFARNVHPKAQQSARDCEWQVAAKSYNEAMTACEAQPDFRVCSNALLSQGAVNLVGVLNALPRMVSRLEEKWAAQSEITTLAEFVVQHPASRLFVEQIVILALGRCVSTQPFSAEAVES